MTKTHQLFQGELHIPQKQGGVVKSFDFDQNIILTNIITLHTGPIELDPTYGSGVFYKKIPKPKLCFDINPRKPEVIQADVFALPLPNECVSCVNFDPPFMARTGPGASMKHRFGELIGKIEDLWDFYEKAMYEIYRVLKPGGWLIFKCQDGVLAGVNNNTYGEICNRAKTIGFVWKDLFILLATHRMMHPKHRTQQHARKYHSYFVVFKKMGINR